MKILVTGASGFIGGRFADFALTQGLEVRVNGRRAEAMQALRARGGDFIQGDLADPALARQLCRDGEAGVHCAGAGGVEGVVDWGGAVGVWGSYAHFHQANVTVTENLIDACVEQGVRRLVHLSSPSVYFDGQAHVGLKEEQLPRRFSDHYGQTKYLAEQRVFAAQARGLEVLA